MKMNVLVSVSNKNGVVELATALTHLGANIISTGGTAQLLRENKIAVTPVSELTGFPEVMDGRVKTLHPYIYTGILARKGHDADKEVLKRFNLEAFDLVIVNLYPFVQTVQNTHSTHQEIIENIDIGGPCMIRAAAKNHQHVGVVVNPEDYSWVIESLNGEGQLSYSQRLQLAGKAFKHCAEYDQYIAHWFANQVQQDGLLPDQLNIMTEAKKTLRYGENPHQQAAFYTLANAHRDSIAQVHQYQGKSLSYNNIMDADAALELVKTFQQKACVIVKHNSPCGVAQSSDLLASYELAYACDRESAFGGIIAFNDQVSDKVVKAIMHNQFFEIIIAPGYSEEALCCLREKENVRVLCYCCETDVSQQDDTSPHLFEIRQVGGGFLYQQKERVPQMDFSVVTQKQPNETMWHDLYFSWNVVRSVKSNAIVYAKLGQTLGIGGGQTSRVMAVELAAMKAQKSHLDLQGSVLASDAFFPFKDSIELAAQQGVGAIIQPGGSVRDKEVIECANKHNIVMVLTHYRCFKH